jgi:hypothetical protein
MATITKTLLDDFVPEFWQKEAMLARMESHFMAERVVGVLKDGMKRGDKVTIPTIGNLSVNDVGGDGSFTPQAPAEGKYTVTVNQWREASVDITDEAEDEICLADAPGIYGTQIGKALSRDLEDFLLALYPNLYSNGQYVTDVANLTEDSVVAAVVKLDNADVPDEDRYFIVRPVQRAALMKLSVFSSRDYVDGRPKQSRVLGDVYGMAVLRSTRVVTADYDGDSTVEGVNLMWHLEAFGLALQKTVKVKPVESGRLSTTIVGHQRFGVDNLRIDHAVICGTTTYN